MELYVGPVPPYAAPVQPYACPVCPYVTVVVPAEALVRNPSTSFREESDLKAAFPPGPKTLHCDLIPLLHGASIFIHLASMLADWPRI